MIQVVAAWAASSGSWFDAKLTFDGLLTFVGGLLAFVAILYQVKHADRGLQRQLATEKQSRESETQERRHSYATALLFEMDNFYRVYVRQLSDSLNSWAGNGPPRIKPVGTEWLAVYRDGAAQIGTLPIETIKPIMTWYGHAQNFISTLNVYCQSYDAGSVYLARCFAMAQTIKGELLGMAEITFFTCGLLCKHVGAEFAPPAISVADDRSVSEEVRTALSDTLKGHKVAVPWERATPSAADIRAEVAAGEKR